MTEPGQKQPRCHEDRKRQEESEDQKSYFQLFRRMGGLRIVEFKLLFIGLVNTKGAGGTLQMALFLLCKHYLAYMCLPIVLFFFTQV